MSERQSSPFRQEAINYHAGARRQGSLIRLSPTWARSTFWVLLALFATTIAYGALGRVHEYATGPGVIRIDGRIDLTAKFEGTVAAVMVQPGQRVREGQPLVQFFMEQEHSEFERLQKEFELQLLKQLRDPLDQAARQTLSTLRAQSELAKTRLAERLIRAPHAGVISDVRIRPGQHLAIGELILTIIPHGARLSLVALLPGRYRPMLHPGSSLRFELVGYRYEYHDLTIDSIGDEIVGPNEAKRYLGPSVSDSLTIDEPVVLVRTTLLAHRFRSDGQSFEYFDGLHAQVQAQVRSEPILWLVLPALKTLVHDGS